MGRQSIFITGGTGYFGSRLIPLLAQRDHSVRVLVRKGSERKLPFGYKPVEGNALGVFLYHMSGQKRDTGFFSFPFSSSDRFLLTKRTPARTSMACHVLTNCRLAMSPP